MEYKIMEEADIEKLLPSYIDYYNTYDGCQWIKEKAYKRIHQIWSREDSYCLMAKDNEEILGIILGYFQQYHDLMTLANLTICKFFYCYYVINCIIVTIPDIALIIAPIFTIFILILM